MFPEKCKKVKLSLTLSPECCMILSIADLSNASKSSSVSSTVRVETVSSRTGAGLKPYITREVQ
jgi:hypothetical protein